MKEIFLSSLYLFILFCISNFIFVPTYLYYEIWWLDIPMHILGGAGVASFFISILNYQNKKVDYIKIILFVFISTLFWELYEYLYLYLYLGHDWNGVLDAVKDIVDGLIGGTISYLIYKK